MKISVQPKETDRVQLVSFNQEQQFFAVGTNTGFSIFSCEPLQMKQQKEFQSAGGISTAEMLFQTNIVALAGGGREPRWPPNEVRLWDMHPERDRMVGCLTFNHEVRNVKMRRDIVVTILEESVAIHNFEDLSPVQTIPTAPNPKGLCALSHGATAAMAIPGHEEGSISVLLIAESKQHLIRSAHDSALSALAINLSATRVASASVTGTLVRVFDAKNGQKLQELRRGMDPADIGCLCFSHTSRWLCAASDKGTVHIFSCAEACGNEANRSAPDNLRNYPPGAEANGQAHEQQEPAANPKSSLGFLKSYLPIPIPKYFDSEWSFAQFQLPPMMRECAFGTDGVSIFAAGKDGMFYHGSFDPVQGGLCNLLLKESLF